MSQQTTITILVDNACADGLTSEWGLSMHIATPTQSILLDFGQSNAFARNAHALGIDLSHVDHAVLSHAHYDHANGMEAFFAINSHAPIHLSEACAENCWSTSAGTKEPHYIGIQEGLLTRYRARLVTHPIDRPTSIAPCIQVAPHAHNSTNRPGQTEGMYVKTADELVPDTFSHEITLACVLCDSRIAVLSSCSHAGVATILQEVTTAFPHHIIAAFVGGLHLMHADDEEVANVAQAFNTYDVQHVWCGHCTSEHATKLLQQMLPHRVSTLHPGLVITL